MFNMEKFIIGVIILLIGITIWSAWHERTHCIKWHYEKQYEPPMYLNPGQDGGISMPLSNGKWVDVKICDEYE